jgi:ribosomal protein S27AE
MDEPLTVDVHTDPACTDHPHCPFCGGVLLDEGVRVVCAVCGTDAEVVEVRAVVSS